MKFHLYFLLLSSLHGIRQLGSIKVSISLTCANMLAAFAKFSLLTLGVDAEGSICPGALTSGWPVSSHSTEDRIVSVLPGRCIKASPFGNKQGTLLTEPGTIVPLEASEWAGTVGWGEWYPL